MNTFDPNISADEIGQAPMAATKPIYPGFEFMGIRVTYIRSDKQDGWGNHEGDVLSRTLFDISSLHDPIPSKTSGLVKATGIRIILGRHSLWILR